MRNFSYNDDFTTDMSFSLYYDDELGGELIALPLTEQSIVIESVFILRQLHYHILLQLVGRILIIQMQQYTLRFKCSN